MKSVLLIDDDAVQLATREAVLRRSGLNVHVATTGRGALAVLGAPSVVDQIGVIVTDHIMPQMGGVELVRELRGRGFTLPVIVLSGMADVQEEYAGMDVIFRTKPVGPPEFIELVKSVLENRFAA